MIGSEIVPHPELDGKLTLLDILGKMLGYLIGWGLTDYFSPEMITEIKTKELSTRLWT